MYILDKNVSKKIMTNLINFPSLFCQVWWQSIGNKRVFHSFIIISQSRQKCSSSTSMSPLSVVWSSASYAFSRTSWEIVFLFTNKKRVNVFIIGRKVGVTYNMIFLGFLQSWILIVQNVEKFPIPNALLGAIDGIIGENKLEKRWSWMQFHELILNIFWISTI